MTDNPCTVAKISIKLNHTIFIISIQKVELLISGSAMSSVLGNSTSIIPLSPSLPLKAIKEAGLSSPDDNKKY